MHRNPKNAVQWSLKTKINRPVSGDRESKLRQESCKRRNPVRHPGLPLRLASAPQMNPIVEEKRDAVPAPPSTEE